MSALADMLNFYTNLAWEKSKDGAVTPSAALLADRGEVARRYSHPSEVGVPPADIVMTNYVLSAAEIAEALRDLLLVLNMPPSEARNMKIGSLAAALQTAEYRLRMVTRS